MPEGHLVRVDLPQSPYDITIQEGLLDQTGGLIQTLFACKRVGIVSDTTVAPFYLDRVVASLSENGIDTVTAILPAGESNKTLPTLLPVYDALLSARIERSTPILALGGGVVGDMTGFVAATLLRGVPFIQIPTTLLSMVDASVGGKTGVDHQAGKNLIGAFHQPRAVWIDPAALKTLPARELHSGLAECIKHEIIRDGDGFTRLERDIDKAISLDMNFLSELIAHNVQIKSRVVAADPFERGERTHLNFGHTFGHAIESVSNYSYSHGEAIALGMVCASWAAVQLRMLEQADFQRIIALFRRANLPTSGLALDPDTIIDAMYSDKKVASGRLRFILPTRIGEVVIRDDLPRQLIKDALISFSGR